MRFRENLFSSLESRSTVTRMVVRSFLRGILCRHCDTTCCCCFKVCGVSVYQVWVCIFSCACTLHAPHTYLSRCTRMQCVAVCCSVLQCATVCYSVLQCDAACCSMLQCAAMCCSVLLCIAVRCNVLLCVTVHTGTCIIHM